MATNSTISGIVNAQSFFRDILGNLPDGTNDTTEAIRRNGNIGINTNPVSTLDVNSNAALTIPILTLDNLTGNYQTFIVDANPNTVVTGSVGDFANDVVNGIIYYKASGNATNTGWVALTPTNFSFFGSGVTGNTPPDGTNDLTEGITRQGSVGIKVVDATTLAAALDVNGAEVLRAIALTNFTANGAIGTAPATVDVASTLNIPQTTAGITLTIPAPTIGVAGRMLLVNNTGNTNVTVGGKVIAPATGILYSWSGAAWIPYVQAATLGSIDAHTDVDTTTVAPTIGQTLIWNGVNWVPGASTAAPTIQRTTTAASTTIQPFPLVNTLGLAPTNATFTNPSATRSMTLLITFKFGEMLYRFKLNEVFNIAMRGNCWVNGVRVNAPADVDRRVAVNTANAGGGQLEYTTGTKDYDHTMTLAAGATVTLMQDYDYNINTAPPANNGGRILCEPSTIVVVGWLN